MDNFEKLKATSLEEAAEVLCDNADCDICPAMDKQYCESHDLVECSKAMKLYLMQEAD